MISAVRMPAPYRNSSIRAHSTCWRAAGCPFMPVRPPAGPEAHARGGPEVISEVIFK